VLFPYIIHRFKKRRSLKTHYKKRKEKKQNQMNGTLSQKEKSARRLCLDVHTMREYTRSDKVKENVYVYEYLHPKEIEAQVHITHMYFMM